MTRQTLVELNPSDPTCSQIVVQLGFELGLDRSSHLIMYLILKFDHFFSYYTVTDVLNIDFRVLGF